MLHIYHHLYDRRLHAALGVSDEALHVTTCGELARGQSGSIKTGRRICGSIINLPRLWLRKCFFQKRQKEPERHALILTRALRHASSFAQRFGRPRIEQKELDVVRRGGDAVNM
jgi:hypothetical protein